MKTRGLGLGLQQRHQPGPLGGPEKSGEGVQKWWCSFRGEQLISVLTNSFKKKKKAQRQLFRKVGEQRADFSFSDSSTPPHTLPPEVGVLLCPLSLPLEMFKTSRQAEAPGERSRWELPSPGPTHLCDGKLNGWSLSVTHTGRTLWGRVSKRGTGTLLGK